MGQRYKTLIMTKAVSIREVAWQDYMYSSLSLNYYESKGILMKISSEKLDHFEAMNTSMKWKSYIMFLWNLILFHPFSKDGRKLNLLWIPVIKKLNLGKQSMGFSNVLLSTLDPEQHKTTCLRVSTPDNKPQRTRFWTNDCRCICQSSFWREFWSFEDYQFEWSLLTLSFEWNYTPGPSFSKHH